jgi:hypothetical protein
MGLATPVVSLESPDSLTGFLTQRFTVLGKIIILIGDTRGVKTTGTIVMFSSTGRLVKLQSSLTDLIGTRV